MSRWRIMCVAALIVLPFVGLAGAGTYYLWDAGLAFYVWWPIFLCMALGYGLGWYWQHKRVLLRPHSFDALPHWTERDVAAWQRVEARAKAAAKLDSAQMSEFQFYVTTAEQMALELAAFYHPHAQDPIGNLTIPEILAVVELASHDMAEIVDRYLPGGHLLTINDWRRARVATEWYQSANNLYWLISALFTPIGTTVRFAASKVGLSTPFQMLQQNLLLWFYTAYVHRVGNYLIELHSGRLRIGAARYRALLDKLPPSTDGSKPEGGPLALKLDQMKPPKDEAVDQIKQLTVTLVGQVKAGKSSLINALLGAQLARTDVLPATAGIQRYDLQTPGIPTRFVLLDTVGYGHAGPKEDQLKATRDAAQQSDLVFLVLHALTPARQADLELLKDLKTWFASHPHLKKPPLFAVLSHIDLLSPTLEWSPPYNWEKPTRAKEQSIRQALATVYDQIGPYVSALVPVCTAPGKVFGVEEWLLPAIAQKLDEVHGVALLRCIRAETDAGKMQKLFYQFLETGKEAARIAWEMLAKTRGTDMA
jgi:predicted GTPase